MWRQELKNKGWYLVPRTERSLPLSPIKIAKLLNFRRIDVSRLIPNDKKLARPNTLSSRFGYGAFPAHTDFALEDMPPRYLILSAPLPRFTETYLYHSKELFSVMNGVQLNRCLFKVSGLKTKFYSNLIANHNNEIFFRYNPAIMSPINEEAVVVDEYICNVWQPTIAIDWKEIRTAIIDNWAIFHSRGKCNFNGLNSGLWRLAIWGD